MSKKKKVNTSQLQKIEAAHQRNEFLERMKQFCDKVAGPMVFELIPAKELQALYTFRSRPVRMEAAPGQTISPRMLKEARGMLSILKTRPMYLGVGEVETMTLYEFLTIGMTLILYATQVKESDYSNAMIVKLKLSPLAAFPNSEAYHLAHADYYAVMSLIGVVNSNIASQLYVLRDVSRDEFKDVSGMFSFMDVYAFQPEKIQVTIDGNSRPVFRVGMPAMEAQSLDYIGVNSEMLNLSPGVLLPVYIQSHALERLSERMDGVAAGFLHFHIYLAFKTPVVCKNKRGEWLFEFYLLQKKVGYFKADVIDGKIILRTFLFLTNNGTPEGEQLHEHTGIMKEDKMYLTIDKFSSFIHSDIQSNENVKDIFIKAGCGSLFEIEKTVCLQKGSDKTIANLIENYLK